MTLEQRQAMRARLALTRPMMAKEAKDGIFNWASSAPVFPGRQVAARPPASQPAQPPASHPIQTQGPAAQVGQQARGALDWLGKNSPLMPTYQRTGSPLYTLPEPRAKAWAGTTGAFGRTQGNPILATINPMTTDMGVPTDQVAPTLRARGYSPVDGQPGTYSKLINPVELSPQTRSILTAASQGTMMGAGGRVEGAVRQGIGDMGMLSKIMGARSYFGPIRQDIHSLHAKAQELEQAGHKGQARDLYRQADLLTRTVTRAEPQAEARMAPVRAWATAGIGAMGLLFLLFKLFGGRR